jgi:outer membrane murein-binding lipoprotein Lpp
MEETMDYKKVGAAGVLLTLLLSGCGAQAKTQDTATQGAATQESAKQETAKQDASQETKQTKQPQMNEKERQMMFTFQSLVMMDKADGLAITKEQAEPMLTVVQDSITKGELTSDAQTKLTEKLTAEQKKYFDDSASRMQQRMDGNKQGNTKSGDNSKPAAGKGQGQGQTQGDAATNPQAAADAKTQENTGTQQGQGQAAQGAAADGKTGQEKSMRGGMGGGKNTGQQLVELLQTKLKS